MKRLLPAALLALALTVPLVAEAKPSWRALDRDLHKAILYSADVWNVDYDWLHNCAHGEGGHGRFINSPGDGDGWFQFLPDTWQRMAFGRPYNSWSDGYKLGPGFTPPTKYRQITSRLGQAWTAAWAFSKGLSREWFGDGC